MIRTITYLQFLVCGSSSSSLSSALCAADIDKPLIPSPHSFSPLKIIFIIRCSGQLECIFISTVFPKALFTRNICISVYVKIQEWVLWQQVMVFIHNVYAFKNGTVKIKQKCKRRLYVWMDLRITSCSYFNRDLLEFYWVGIIVYQHIGECRTHLGYIDCDIYQTNGLIRQNLCVTGTGTRTDTISKYRSHFSSHISCSVKVWHKRVLVPFPHKFWISHKNDFLSIKLRRSLVIDFQKKLMERKLH